MSAPAWCSDPAEVLRLARWLADRDMFGGKTRKEGIGEVLYFFQKPWKWDDERREMLAVEAGDLVVCKDCDETYRPASEAYAEAKLCDDCLERRLDVELEQRGALRGES